MEKIEQQLNYERIAKAIQFIQNNYQAQPHLDVIADHIHLSPFHFQRLFQEWAGTTPKKFLQYISLAHAKELIKNNASISEATYNVGLSSTSRLHELFVNIEAMTPADYKNQGQQLSIKYSFHESPFGKVIIGSTSKGVCHIAFIENQETGLLELKDKFPNASFQYAAAEDHKNILTIFDSSSISNKPINLHLKGTPFQLKVWEALLKIPYGQLCTYGQIGQLIDMPTASRAIGTAIGSNPIAYLIPCHRVIQSSGHFGGYMWHPTRKAAIIGWESAHNKTDDNATI